MTTPVSHGGPLGKIRESTEREALVRVLASTMNKTDAAAMLGIHRTLLCRKMKKYKIGLPENKV